MTSKPVDYARYSVLVIDDQPFVRKAMGQLLKLIGFRHIAEAEDGESGILHCIESNPALIVCDIEMKPLSGLEFLSMLRSRADVPNNRTPVIVLTIHSDTDNVRQAMKLGANDFIVKPATFASMKERIDRILITH